MTNLPTIGIIGAGKVGSSLARLWHEAGCDVCAVYSPQREHAEGLALLVRAEVANSALEVVQKSDLTLLTVPDDVIAPLAEDIANQLAGERLQNKAIIHTSGSRDRTALAMLADSGAMTGSLHPAFPFADAEQITQSLQGVAFAVEAQDVVLRDWLFALVAVLGGVVIDIPAGGKAQYHAALVIASNYTVTLYAIAEKLLMQMGATTQTANAALNPLMQATVGNLREQGIPNALTGPLVRADVGTLETHMNALADIDSRLLDVYSQLARLSYPMLDARGVDTDTIETLLKIQT